MTSERTLTSASDGCPSSLFSCYEFGESRGRCYTRQDRCSGSKVCDNYADERNCSK